MEAPQLEMVKQQFIDEEVVLITAGKSWGQPYSCEEWATTFGLTIPVLDDEIDSLSSIFGNSIPYNNAKVLPHDPPKRYHLSIFNDFLKSSISEIKSWVLL